MTAVNTENSEERSFPRITWVDTLRGLAIVLMMVYHFAYDLSHFGWYDSDVGGRSAWLPFRYLILTMFISLMAISVNLSHRAGFRPKPCAIWLFKVGGCALLVSFGTSLQFTHSWVYFGILHFMVVASLVVLLLRPYALVSLLLGVAIVVTHWVDIWVTDILPYGWPISYIKHWFHGGRSVDFVPMVPWMGVALIASGVSLKLVALERVQSWVSKLPSFLTFFGRHSLLIYMIHQPIFFGILYSVKYLFSL